MKSKSVDEVINANYRAFTLLGIATSIMFDVKKKLPASEHDQLDWFLNAINDVVYLNKPISLDTMPERKK